MSPEIFLTLLRKRGIEISISENGDSIKCVDTQNSMTPEIADVIRAKKQELINCLSWGDGGSCRPAQAYRNGGAGVAEPVPVEWWTVPEMFAQAMEAFETPAAGRGEDPETAQALSDLPEDIRDCRYRSVPHAAAAWWQSFHGPHWICGVCSPPARESIVRKWYRPAAQAAGAGR